MPAVEQGHGALTVPPETDRRDITLPAWYNLNCRLAVVPVGRDYSPGRVLTSGHHDGHNHLVPDLQLGDHGSEPTTG